MDEYLKEILNKSYGKVLRNVKFIRNNTKCPNCNGTLSNGECKYCGTEIKEIKENIEKLNNELDQLFEIIIKTGQKNIPNNHLSNLLISIKGAGLERVNDYFSYFPLSNIKEEKIEEILAKIKGGHILTEDELLIIERFVYEKRENVLDNIYDYFIFLYLCNIEDKSILLRPDCLEILLKMKTESLMKNYCNNYECRIVPSSKLECGGMMALADASGAFGTENLINLSDQTVRELYADGKETVISSIFHELTHIYQRNVVMRSPHAFTMFSLDEIKDAILSLIHKNYYKENYDNISFEIEAYYKSYYESLKYFKSLNFQVNEDRILKEMNDLLEKFKVCQRKLNGQEIDLDEYFYDFIKDKPLLLERYPQLKVEYKVENEIVVKKEIEELFSDYNKYLEIKAKLSEEDQQGYDYFYNSHLSLNKVKSDR